MRYAVVGASCFLLGFLPCCGGSTAKEFLAGPDGGYVSLGSPCTPSLENDPSFGGYDLHEVWTEYGPGQPKSAPVCLVNQFQGRVSCPYGQPADAGGGAACITPQGKPVTAKVSPQCTNRRSSGLVVWSCQCAASEWSNDDDGGGEYCTCPSGTSCTSLARSWYCLPAGASDGLFACTSECQPGVHPCD
jgi:hypothetical protein